MPLRKIKGGMLPGIGLNRLAKNKHVRRALRLRGGGGGRVTGPLSASPKAAKATRKKKASGKSRKTQNTRQIKKKRY
tara:strand:+ start:82 stop:312 length:231 start_codon:yes stop_codon:yes gene_type:complete